MLFREYMRSRCSTDAENTCYIYGCRWGAVRDLHSRDKWCSSLEIIVRHEVEGFSSDELFNLLIQEKWVTFGRTMYLRRSFFPYILLLGIFTAMHNLHTHQQRAIWELQRAGTRAPAVLWLHPEMLKG